MQDAENTLYKSLLACQCELQKLRKAEHDTKESQIINKQILGGVKENPNNLITKLAGVKLNQDEIDILKLCIFYSISSRPTKNMICVMGKVWEQISKKNLCNENS